MYSLFTFCFPISLIKDPKHSTENQHPSSLSYEEYMKEKGLNASNAMFKAKVLCF